VRDSLGQIQKLFRIRNCRDSFFANRSRPCLQHQIGRCSAPCVGLIGREEYGQDMEAAVKVLEGRSDEVNAQLQERMEAAAADPGLLATDAAEALVAEGVPFRDAHEQVAGAVRDGVFDPDSTAAESAAARLGDVRAAVAAGRARFQAT